MAVTTVPVLNGTGWPVKQEARKRSTSCYLDIQRTHGASPALHTDSPLNAIKRMAIRRFNWELVVGVCGIAIGLISLAYTHRQLQLSERHDRVSVQPRITLAFHSDSKRDRYGWYMSNNGLGPAYFTGFKLFVDGEPMTSTALGGWMEALAKLNLRADCFSTSWTPPETSISFGPDVDEPLIRLKTPATQECEAEFVKLMASLNRLKVRINYQSIYGESFQRTEQPTRLF